MRFKKIFLVLISTFLLVIPASAQSDEDETVKIVYQCDFPDVKRVHFMLNTLGNVVKYYQKKFIDFELDVVFLGPGLQYMMKDFKGTGYARKPYLTHGGPTGKGTKDRFDNLKATGGDSVNFYVCKNTMKKKNVKAEQIDDKAEIVPAGVIKIVELQQEGAAYIKIK